MFGSTDSDRGPFSQFEDIPVFAEDDEFAARARAKGGEGLLTEGTDPDPRETGSGPGACAGICSHELAVMTGEQDFARERGEILAAVDEASGISCN